MNTSINNVEKNNFIKSIPIETALKLVHQFLEVPHLKIKGSYYTIFEDEILEFLHKRNIYTIDKVNAKHLVLIMANFANKYGNNEIRRFLDLLKTSFQVAGIIGIVDNENNPAFILERIFPDRPFTIIS